MTEDDFLTERLHRLAAGIVPPPNDGRSDLRRGRRHLRRTRAGAAVGAAAAVVAITVGAVAIQDSGSTALEPTDNGPTSAAPAATTGTSHAESDKVPPAKTTRGSGFPRRFGAPPGAKAALSVYNDLLAEHLDPSRQHLEQYDGVGFHGVGLPGAAGEVGAKFAWTTAGERGEGMLQVAVDLRAWRHSNIRLSHEDAWRPFDAQLPAGWTAEAANYDGGTAVVVHRPDGVSVAIDANTLFGNNSLTPVSGFAFGTADLVTAASDPRFVYPS